MNRDTSWQSLVATLGPIGFLPAPGTCGTLVSALGFAGFAAFSYPLFLLLLASVTVVGCYALHTLTQRGVGDEPSIVIDEVLATGLLVVLFSGWLLVGALGIFRFFDITKKAGIAWCERLPGVWGIVGDDLLAAIYAAGCIACLRAFFL